MSYMGCCGHSETSVRAGLEPAKTDSASVTLWTRVVTTDFDKLPHATLRFKAAMLGEALGFHDQE